MEAILYFFRLNWKGDEFENLPTMGRKNVAKEKAKAFIDYLCSVAFEERSVATYVPHSRQRVLKAMRAQFVPTLQGLGKLHLLATQQLRGGTEPRVLREVLRLARETHTTDPRTGLVGKPRNLQEALAHASPPALVLAQLIPLRRALRTLD